MGGCASCKERAPPPGTGFNVGKSEFFKENSVREVAVNDNDTVLVARYKGKLYGVGAYCTHYGAPLSDGVFSEGKIKCPWHGACFNVKTGDIEDYPGMDCLPTYKVVTERGNVTVFCNKPLESKMSRPMSKCEDENKCIVIIGGGIAGLCAAETLRSNNYQGKICIIEKHQHLPYDRTVLSKNIGVSVDSLRLRDEAFLKNAAIEILNESECTSLNFRKQSIRMNNVDLVLAYDKLLIATGSRPKLLHPKVRQEKNLLTLYTVEDSERIARKTKGKNVVIVGGTFLGLELAWVLHNECSKVTLILKSAVPMEYLLGKTVGTTIHVQARQLCPAVTFHGPDDVIKYEHNNLGEVSKVITAMGGALNCDLVIEAVWTIPDTKFISEYSRLVLDAETRAVIVNNHMETNVKNIYAAGDVTKFPLGLCCNKLTRVVGWKVAGLQGKIAALNMLGIVTPISNCIPYFWASFFGMDMRVCGYIDEADEILIFMDNDFFVVIEFCALYRKAGKTVGAVTSGCDPIATHVKTDLAKGTEHNEWPKYITERFSSPPIKELLYYRMSTTDLKFERRFEIVDE